MTATEIRRCLDSLFKRAKAADEFEYASALLRIRGIEDLGWDPLSETQAITADLLALAQTPLHPRTKMRLGLLLYCHLTEVDAIHDILENMLRVTDGERASIAPFQHLRRGRVPPSASRVVGALCEHARGSRRRKLAEVLEWEFNDAVRNAFFHSDYILYEDELRSREGRFEQPNGTIAGSMKLEQLEALINRGLRFYQLFMETFDRHRRSYDRDRRIKGRVGGDDQVIPVTLLADSRRGLYGLSA